MARTFKKGDRVMISKDSPYYGACDSNPKDTSGTVIKVGRTETTGLYISVQWDDTGLTNSYNHLDLQPAASVKMNKPLTVDKEFVMQAYESACSTWKFKIEQKFPELFQDKFAKLTSDEVKSTRLYYKSYSDKGYTELNYNIALIDGIAGSYPEVPTSARFRGLYIHDRFDELDLELVRVHDGYAIIFKKKDS